MSESEEIASLGRQIHEARAHSDRATLERLLAPQYHHVDIYGEVFDRDGWPAYAAKPRSPGALTSRDERVSVTDGVAVLTSTLGLGAYDGGITIRFLQVFVPSGDGWKRRWYQATMLGS